MKLFAILLSCILAPAAANASNVYKCAMKGDAIGPELYMKLVEETSTVVLWDRVIQRFYLDPISRRYKRRGNSRVKVSWSLPTKPSLDYSATFRTDTGKVHVNVTTPGGAIYRGLRLGAKGKCVPTEAAFLKGYPKTPSVLKSETPRQPDLVCPDGSLPRQPRQHGTWHHDCHNKAYRKRNRVSCASYPCW